MAKRQYDVDKILDMVVKLTDLLHVFDMAPKDVATLALLLSVAGNLVPSLVHWLRCQRREAEEMFSGKRRPKRKQKSKRKQKAKSKKRKR